VSGEEAPEPGSSIHRKWSIAPEKKNTVRRKKGRKEKKKEKKNGERNKKKRRKKRSTRNEIGTLEMMMGSKQDAHLPAV
jgi:hypothetical protein